MNKSTKEDKRLNFPGFQFVRILLLAWASCLFLAFDSSGQVPNQWSKTQSYQSGSIVLDAKGVTHIAQKEVKKGIDISDLSYWLSLDNAAPSHIPGTFAPTTTPDTTTIPKNSPMEATVKPVLEKRVTSEYTGGMSGELHECCGGEDLHKEDHEKAGPKPSDPDDNGLVDYKLEWQKESTRLAEIKARIEKEKLRQQQVEQERLKLEKETEQIDLELAKVGKDLSDCMAMGKKLDQELESRRKVLAGLVTTLATLEGEKSSLAAQVGEKGREVLEKTAEYGRLEKEYEPVAMKLAVPHLKGWHYEAEHGWLYVETGSYPYVFSQRMDAWLYYHQGTHQPWEYFDYISQSWIDWR